MDQASPVPVTPVQDSTRIIPTSNNPEEVHKELSKVDTKAVLAGIEKTFVRIISIALVVHGVISLYSEVVEIIYVFPHIPEVLQDTGYAEIGYQSLLKRSVLISATAAIETIYGIAIMSKLNHLVHRLHIFSGVCLLVISIVISRETVSIHSIDANHRIPSSPTIQNLIDAESMEERIQLFKNISPENPKSHN